MADESNKKGFWQTVAEGKKEAERQQKAEKDKKK